ncbi:MAG: hypothetical protein JSS17_07475 [Proteobacteria bacterium]|nr:hypothetical protein [Pseudomonadota bacterium]
MVVAAIAGGGRLEWMLFAGVCLERFRLGQMSVKQVAEARLNTRSIREILGLPKPGKFNV